MITDDSQTISKKKFFRPLKKKLLFAVIIVSTIFTSIVVFFHFKFEYNDSLSSLDKKIHQINESSAPAIASASWQEDRGYLNVQAESLLTIKERKSILVVDDDIDIREAICSFLNLEGYETIEAQNGKEALEIVKDKKIEFVVSDIRMPDGGGLFLVDELRKIDRVIPYVILVTGQADITREEAMQRGALDLLKKPLEMDRIVGLIKFIENSYEDFIEV